jgi:hypothetical protein
MKKPPGNKFALAALAALAVGGGMWGALKPEGAGGPPQAAVAKPGESAEERARKANALPRDFMDHKMPVAQRVDLLKKWLRAGGGKAADRDTVLYSFYTHVSDALTVQEWMDLVINDFPTETQGPFVDSLIKEASRKDPLSAGRFLSQIPPGTMLTQAVGVIAYEAASKGLDMGSFMAFVDQLDYPEDKKRATSRYLETLKWEGMALPAQLVLVDQLPDDASRKYAILLWLSRRTSEAGVLSKDEIGTILGKVEDPALKKELAGQQALSDPETANAGHAHCELCGAGQTCEHDTDKGETPQERAARLNGQGKEAFSVNAQDFGFSKVLEASKGASALEQGYVMAAWFSKVMDHDLVDGVEAFAEHPELQNGQIAESLAIRLVAKDREQLTDWMSAYPDNAFVVKEGIETWADENSMEAGKWLYSLPAGDLRYNSAKAMADWLASKGDAEGAARLREELVRH